MNTASCESNALALRARWLIVDDEAALSEILADVLTGLRLASVENFTSAADALAAFYTQGGDFDLVITDRDMMGLDGLEFARRVHEQTPNAKVILVSAHTDDLTADDLYRAGITAVVNKPFNLAWLEAFVCMTMSEQASTERGMSAGNFAYAA